MLRNSILLTIIGSLALAAHWGRKRMKLAAFATTAFLAIGPWAATGSSAAPSPVTCGQENGAVVCRPAGASFVWCKAAEVLARLEAAVGANPSSTADALKAAAGKCGSTAWVAMNPTNAPEKTAEGDLHPEVSRTVFLAQAAPTATVGVCKAPGFCAVRPGTTAWACPEMRGLDLPVEERARSGCVQVPPGNAAEVLGDSVSNPTVTLTYGPAPAGQRQYTFAASDLVSVDVSPLPVDGGRGWCKPGDWCVTVAPTLFCADGHAYERILAVPAGEARRAAITAEEGCRIASRGNPIKVSVSGYDSEVVEVEHPVFGSGRVSRTAFRPISWTVPIRFTSNVSDIVISPGRGPSLVAVEVQRQGASKARGLFRSGPREAAAFCRETETDRAAVESCAKFISRDEIAVRADCKNMVLTAWDRTLKLRERADGDGSENINPRRAWIWRDVATDEWLDGTSASGEWTIDSAFNALCPGLNPEMAVGIVHRDPKARFPAELLGEWVPEETCRQHRIDREFTDALTVIEPLGREAHEMRERVNLVRRTGRNSWTVDASASGEGDEWQASTDYSLQRDGLYVSDGGEVAKLVRCPPPR